MSITPVYLIAMAQQVVEVEQQHKRGKIVTFLRTDADKTYVFEEWQNSPRAARFVRRGKGRDGRGSLSTNNYTLPSDVRRVANAVLGGEREPCAATARAPESAEPVGWHKE